MATVMFYEKPGCINNTRQKRMLAAAGHEVIARDLLAEPWTADTLRPFLRQLPPAGWFNPSAPRVKSGEIDPDRLDGEQAMALLLADHLLIRRPLMQVGRQCRTGFEPREIDAWIGLGPVPAGVDIETCPQT